MGAGVDVPWVRKGGEIQKKIGEEHGEGAEEFVGGREIRPGGGQIQILADG